VTLATQRRATLFAKRRPDAKRRSSCVLSHEQGDRQQRYEIRQQLWSGVELARAQLVTPASRGRSMHVPSSRRRVGAAGALRRDDALRAREGDHVRGALPVAQSGRYSAPAANAPGTRLRTAKRLADEPSFGSPSSLRETI